MGRLAASPRNGDDNSKTTDVYTETLRRVALAVLRHSSNRHVNDANAVVLGGCLKLPQHLEAMELEGFPDSVPIGSRDHERPPLNTFAEESPSFFGALMNPQGEWKEP